MTFVRTDACLPGSPFRMSGIILDGALVMRIVGREVVRGGFVKLVEESRPHGGVPL
jgi:hypothetical protein